MFQEKGSGRLAPPGGAISLIVMTTVSGLAGPYWAPRHGWPPNNTLQQYTPSADAVHCGSLCRGGQSKNTCSTPYMRYVGQTLRTSEDSIPTAHLSWLSGTFDQLDKFLPKESVTFTPHFVKQYLNILFSYHKYRQDSRTAKPSFRLETNNKHTFGNNSKKKVQ